MVVIDYFSCLISSLMWERVRSMAGSSVVLAGCFAAERLSALVGVTLHACSSDTDLMIGVVGSGASFVLSLAISSDNSHCTRCSSTRVGINRSMVMLGARDGCAADGEVASLWPNEA